MAGCRKGHRDRAGQDGREKQQRPYVEADRRHHVAAECDVRIRRPFAQPSEAQHAWTQGVDRSEIADRIRHRNATFGDLSDAQNMLFLAQNTRRWVGEWRSANGAVLEFENEIEGIKINGVDIITFSDDGKITHFKVMVRPLKGINLLHRLMGEQLAKG